MTVVGMAPQQSRNRVALRHHGPAGLVAAAATIALILAPIRFGPTGLLVTVAVMQVALIAAWSRAVRIRGYVGSLVIGAGTAVTADTVLAQQVEPDLAPLAAILALAFIAALLHQLSRSAPRKLATASLAGVSLIAVSVAAMAAFLPLYRVTDDSKVYLAIVTAVGGAVVVGHVVDLFLPMPHITPDVPRGLTALLMSIGTAIAAAVVLSEPSGLIESLGAAIVGAILGLVAALLAVAASYIAIERARPNWYLPLPQAVLPLAGAAPVAFFLALRVLG